MRTLILGRTARARTLAKRLVGEGWFVTSSLAGRVSNPKLPVGNVCIGGFGDPADLARWLISDATEAIIDAMHPYAEKISESAVEAARTTGISLMALRRPAWKKQPGDNWIEVSSMQEAADVVVDRLYNPPLTISRQQLAPFTGDSNGRCLVRYVGQPTPPLPKNRKITLSRGPYGVAMERRLMQDYTVDYVVTENSGGAATYAEIEATRDLEKPVAIVRRSQLHGAGVTTVATMVNEAYNAVIRRV